MTLVSANFSGNIASGSAYAFTTAIAKVVGGGIDHTSGDLTLVSANFLGNTATALASCAYSFSVSNASAMGGGIYHTAGDLTLTDADFSGNTANALTLTLGGGIYHASGKMTASGANFSGNSVSANGTVKGGGGYIADTVASLTDAVFTGNIASGNGVALGGGLYHENSSLTFTNANFSGNGVFGSRTAYGGGLYHESGDLTLTSADFSGNIAYTSASSYASAMGGGAYVADVMANLTNTTFTGNIASASASARATGFSREEPSASYGGALYLSNTTMDYAVTSGTELANTGNQAQYGGFLYMTNNSTANFTVEENALLTIGDDTNNDSIGGIGLIQKQGTGYLRINSDISSYTGLWTVYTGTLELARIARTIKLDNWTFGENALVILSSLDDTINMTDNKKIATLDLGGGSDVINTNGYALSNGELRVSKLKFTGGGRVFSAITNRNRNSGFDLTLDDVILDSNITGGEAVDQIAITQASTLGGVIDLGDGDNILTGTAEATFRKTLTVGAGNDKLSFTAVSFEDTVTLGDGNNTLTASGTASFVKTLTAANGNDTLSFAAVTFTGAVDLGDGTNSIAATGTAKFLDTLNTGKADDTLTFIDITFSKAVNLGDGNDTLTFGKEEDNSGKVSAAGEIDLGDGENTITVYGTAEFAGITGGSGSDTIDLYKTSTISGEIDLGEGENVIYVEEALTVNGAVKMTEGGETRIVVYRGTTLTDNTLTVYSDESASRDTVNMSWEKQTELDKVRLVVSSDSTFETFEFAVELYNRSKNFTLNLEKGYFVQFQANDEDGWKQRLVDDSVAPEQVTGVEFNGRTLTWEAAQDNPGGNGVKQYTVEVASDSSFTTVIDTRTVTETEYIPSGIDDGTYYFRVCAEDYTHNIGDWSTTVSGLLDTEPPTRPEGGQSTVDGYNVTFSWDAAVDTGSGVAEYEYRVASDSGYETVIVSDTTESLNFSITDLAYGTYYWQVHAIDNVGNIGEWSLSESVKTQDLIAPTTPENVSCSVEEHTVSVLWDASEDDELGSGLKDYTAEISDDSGFTTIAASVTVTEAEAVISDLANGNYYIRVSASDNAGNQSAWSEVQTFTIDASISNPVVITADSISRMYDGTELTAGYTYTGTLEEDDRLVVTVAGFITDAGTTVSTVSEYKIMRGDTDITAKYTNVTTVDGTLEVTKRNVTLTSGSDIKAYDGTALTNDTVTVSGDGFADGEGYTADVTGTQTEIGTGRNTFTYELTDGTKAENYDIVKVEGTLEVVEPAVPVTITAASGTHTYDGTAFSINDYSYTGTLIRGDELVVTVSGEITNAGTADNVVTAYKVMRGDVDVTASYTFKDSVKGTLTVTPRSVILTSNSDSRKYDGTALEGTVEVGGDGFVDGEATVSAGSLTDAGSVTNTITVNEETGFQASNYDITKTEGTLTVTPREVTLTSADDIKIYDGTALTNDTVTVSGDGFADGEGYTAEVTGTQTEIGTSRNTFTYELTDGTKADNYDITKVEGTLEVIEFALPITITAASGTHTYDGTAFSVNDYSYSGILVQGDELIVTVSGEITDAGTADNVVTAYQVMRGDVDVTAGYTFTDSVKGTLTVTPRSVTLTSNSDSRKYDGTALEGTVEVGGDGFVDGEATASAGSLTNAGSVTNTITVIEEAGYKSSNYDITRSEGTLTVTPREITLTSADDTKVYDGMALTNETVNVSGDGFADGEGYTAEVTGAQTKIGTSGNTFTYELTAGTLSDNYNITEVEGNLTVTPVTDAITITASSARKIYDGTALSAGYSYTGALAAGDELMVTLEGTITDAGTVANEISKYRIMHGDTDVTDCYSNVTIVNGILEIAKRSVTLTSGSKSWIWDGEAHSYESVTVTGDGFVSGEGVEYSSFAEITEVGTADNTFVYTLNEGIRAENYDITVYTGTLEITPMLIPSGLSGDSNGVSWQGTASSFTVAYSQDDFESNLTVETSGHALDTFGMPTGSYDWHVRNSDSEEWVQGEEISAVRATEPQALSSDADGNGDIFFASGSDVWESGYAAEHVGCGTWSGTEEQAELAGKNKITDVFEGSSDANILVMTDDVNGDALFVDDIYSAFPAERQARIAQIDEIRAGDGDDIVDMTSQRFAYSGDGVTIRGGNGNDVIWANSGNNRLFGDAGNDRIVGASGNDVIAGGIGDDSMHGGGGDDIFCFCKSWGTDTVEQLSGGDVTLWFASGSEDNWDQRTMTYTAGANTVRVTGVTQVTLKFGDDDSALYDELLADGAFTDASSSKIFEDDSKGIIAVL